MKINGTKVVFLANIVALILILNELRPYFENRVDYTLFGVGLAVIIGTNLAILSLCVQILRKLEGNISSQNKSVDESITEARPSVTEDNTR